MASGAKPTERPPATGRGQVSAPDPDPVEDGVPAPGAGAAGHVPRPVAAAFLAALEAEAPQCKDDVHRVKQGVLRAHRGMHMPSDRELLQMLPPAAQAHWAPLLRQKPMRSGSGVAVVAVMSSPAACPHGKCVYCPGGPEVGVPQSYTGHEPSTMRAIRWAYDPYRIVRARLWQLQRNGHPVDKVDVVVQGGTFPARDPAYQDWFVAGIYAGLNDGPAEEPLTWEDEEAWAALSQAERDDRLTAAQAANETASCRAIGLTIETKPDWCLEPHVDDMLRLGCTRVEIGLQCLDDETLRFTHRGHTLQDARDAMRIARDAGLKVCVHLMPGQPRPRDGAIQPVPAEDLEDFRRLFAEEAWRPDMLKVYPTLVVQEGDTPLKRWWTEGRYTPYDTAAAQGIIARGLFHVPEYCRIQRIDRDIPTTHVEAGVQNSNLRQIAESRARTEGVPLRELRIREAAGRAREGRPADPERLIMVRRAHDAGGARELFLSLEDPLADAVVGFLRLRRVGVSAHRLECRGAAIVRELKVYGQQVALGDGPSAGAWQHRGLGARLLEAGEAQAAEWGARRVLVTAGVGVKAYYGRHGYAPLGPYMTKELPCLPPSSVSSPSTGSCATPQN